MKIFTETDGEVCLKINRDKGKDAADLLKMLYTWKEQSGKLSAEEISREKYRRWRYHYLRFNITQIWAKVLSKGLSDALDEAFKDKLRND